MEIFDSHAHLYLPEFATDFEEVVQRARDAGVTRLVNIGIDVQSSRVSLELARNNPGFYASVGWHPHDAKDIGKDDYPELKRLAGEKEVVGFGEIGLDFYRDHSPRDVQLSVLDALLGVAEEAQKPVIIHSREAFKETSSILKSHRNKLKGILIHCFGGTYEEARTYLDLGAFLSIPGTVTYKNAKDLKAAVKNLPHDRVLIETDAPYLAPTPFRGKRNEPAYLKYHIAAIAALWENEEESVASMTFRNASAFFGLEESAGA
jgi:TatD DNase family protein